MKKLTPLQIEKYDINQKVIKALTNLESRTVLFSIKEKSKFAEEISTETSIPLSSVYKKLEDLEKLGLVKIDKIRLSDSGNRLKYFKSRISEAQISFKKSELKLELQKN